MNKETSLKEALDKFHQEQRDAAAKHVKNMKKDDNPNKSKKYGNQYFTRFHDRFDYFK